MNMINLDESALERVNALPVNLAYLGWCDLRIPDLRSSELLKQKEFFNVVCYSPSSFESASWIKYAEKTKER